MVQNVDFPVLTADVIFDMATNYLENMVGDDRIDDNKYDLIVFSNKCGSYYVHYRGNILDDQIIEILVNKFQKKYTRHLVSQSKNFAHLCISIVPKMIKGLQKNPLVCSEDFF